VHNLAIIQSGATTDLLTVDPTSKAGRVSIYDAAGNLLSAANRAAIAETAGGVMNAGKDYKLSRTIRASSTGGLHVAGDGSVALWDSFEGTVRNLNQWIETATTMASAQTLAVGLTLNSGSTLTTTTGILESSHRQFPVIARGSLIFRARLRVQGATNCFEEWGFGDATTATTAVINNGAFFRRDGAGSLQPILAFNGTEGAGPTMTAPATTEYAWYEIFLEDDRATFTITSVTGVLISSQVMERGATGGSGTGVATAARLFAVTHIPAFFRVYNSGAAGTAPQIVVNHCSVTIADMWSQRDHRVAMSGIGLNSLTSPTAFTQLANYANSAAPASATLSNTAAGYTTLGGQWQFAAVAGAETDYALFGWANPSPYTFFCTGIRIGETLNLVAAVATTATILQWGVAFNSSAVSLATGAPYSPMRKQIGSQAFPIASAIGAIQPGIPWTPGTPMAVQPGRFLHIILKMPVASATATEIFRGSVAIDGFFE
jgi:hypothetical protein